MHQQKMEEFVHLLLSVQKGQKDSNQASFNFHLLADVLWIQ